MKFGGMSTPWGIYFYGDNYESSIINGKLKIKKNDKPGKHGIYLLLIAYLFFDIAINFREQIKYIFSYISSHAPTIPYHTTNPLSISIVFNYTFPEWVIEYFIYTIIVLEYGFLIWFMYKVRGYHGAEHKAILAALKGDTNKARAASRITSHCGSNLLFPYLFFMALSSYLGYTLIGTSMALSFVLYGKVPLARRYLSYIGSSVQRLTTKEPSDKELKEAQRGINAIIKADEIRVYRQIKPFFIQLPMRT